MAKDKNNNTQIAATAKKPNDNANRIVAVVVEDGKVVADSSNHGVQQ
jgi:hypothetical protein